MKVRIELVEKPEDWDTTINKEENSVIIRVHEQFAENLKTHRIVEFIIPEVKVVN